MLSPSALSTTTSGSPPARALSTWAAIPGTELVTAFLLAAVFSSFAIWFGLPWPAVDDLMFSGAAFEISRSGELKNPLLADQFGTDVFLVYPPFYAFLLGGWLRLTGISTGALLVFQHVCYLVAGHSLSFWLARRHSLGRPRWLWPALFATGLLGSLGTMGLRPEAAGFAVLMLGLCLRETGPAAVHVLGWVLIGSSVVIAPHMLTYAVALTAIAQWWTPPGRPTPLSQWKLVIVAALLVVTGFLWSIGGRLEEFLVALTTHASRTSLALRAALAVSWTRTSPLLFRDLVGLAAAATFLIALLSGRGLGRRRFLLATTAIAVAGITSAILDVARDELRLFTVVMWSFVSLAWFSAKPNRLVIATFGVLVLLVAICWDQRRNWPLLSTAGRPHSTSIAAAKAAVANNPDKKLLIDSHAARHLFDYRIPPHARDWMFSRPFPRMWPDSLSDHAPDELWIISGERLWMIEPHLAPEMVPVFSLFGRTLFRPPGAQNLVVIEPPSLP